MLSSKEISNLSETNSDLLVVGHEVLVLFSCSGDNVDPFRLTYCNPLKNMKHSSKADNKKMHSKSINMG